MIQKINNRKYQPGGKKQLKLYELTTPELIDQYNKEQEKNKPLVNPFDKYKSPISLPSNNNTNKVEYDIPSITTNKEPFVYQGEITQGKPNNPYKAVSELITKPITFFSKRVNPNFHGAHVLDYALPLPGNILGNIVDYGSAVKDVLTTPETYTDALQTAERLIKPNSPGSANNQQVLNTILNGITIAPIAKPLKEIGLATTKAAKATLLDFQDLKNILNFALDYKRNYKNYTDIQRKNIYEDVKDNILERSIGPISELAVPILKLPVVNKEAKKIAFLISAKYNAPIRTANDVKESINNYFRNKLYIDSNFNNYIGSKKSIGYLGQDNKNEIRTKESLLYSSFFGLDNIKTKLKPLDKYAAKYVNKKSGDLHPTIELTYKDYIKKENDNRLIKNLAQSKLSAYHPNFYNELETFLKHKYKNNPQKELEAIKELKNIGSIKDFYSLYKTHGGKKKYITSSSDFDMGMLFNEDIGGHMMFLNDKGIYIRDVWKFDPYDYGYKWRDERLKNNLFKRNFSKTYGMANLLNTVTKPVILSKYIKFN